MARRVNITMPSPNKLVDIHLTGDWQQVILGMDSASQEVLKGYNAAVEEFSNKVLKIVRTAIATGQGPNGVRWEPHSPKYTRSYGKHPIYRLTGQYYSAVGVYGNRSRTWIGLPYNARYSRTGSHSLTLNQIAILLEYGRGGGAGSNHVEGEEGEEDGYDNSTSYMPARPLWAPAFIEAGGKRKLEDRLLYHIRSHLAKAFKVNHNQIKLHSRKSPYK